jgi:Family of unknown function (DUF6236)
MNRTILYYPTIDIPRSSWLRHALLYWDEVSSIVPKSWDNEMLVELSPDIHYLMEEEQFRPIKPEDIFKKDNWDILEQFQDEFREIVSSREYQGFIDRKNRNFSRLHINKVDRAGFSRIHRNKTSDGILYFLEEIGLASRNRENPEWLLFENNTALLYMSLMAKYLADIDSDQTTIGTDNFMYEKFNFRRVTKDKGFPVVSFSLNNILPTPKENVPFERIVDFKRRRADNLLHFKRTISDFQTKVSKTQSQAELKEAAIAFKESIAAGVMDLNAVLGDSRIESTFKTFKSLINLKSPTLIASTAAILNEKTHLVNVPFSIEAAGVAVAGVLDLTCNFIEARNRNRVRLRESPFSYVYQAQRYGIIDRFRK